MTDQLKGAYDALVIGGGAAGLNGALMLGRARRSTAVVDAGSPRNEPAAGVHGLLGREGVNPGALLEQGRAEIRRYGGHIVSGAVATVAPAAAESPRTEAAVGFIVTLTDGRRVHARRVLVTSGLVDELPEIPGLREHWGRGVLHCPYCHGWEVRDQAIGVLATGPMSVHQALLFRQWSNDVTYFAHTLPAPTTEQAEQLAARDIPVVPGEVTSVAAEGDQITGIHLADGTLVKRQAITVAPRMVARTDFLAGIGLRPEQHPSGMGEHIPTDATGRTAVTGVWAAGNVTDLAAQVGAAAAAGANAAAQINADLLKEETDRAVARRRAAEGTAPLVQPAH